MRSPAKLTRPLLILALMGILALAVSACGTTSADPERGRALFIQKCGVCHAMAQAGTTAEVGPDLDAAFAAARAVGADSDISIWIGTKTNPYTNHLTLSDALLASFIKEDNATPTVATGDRWADFNANKLSGNVVVISSLVGDQTPEDAFKLAKLAISCP